MRIVTIGSLWNKEILKSMLICGDIPLDLSEVYGVDRSTINKCLEKMKTADLTHHSPMFDPPGTPDEDCWYHGIPIVIRRQYQKRKKKAESSDVKKRRRKTRDKSRTTRVSYTISQKAIDRGIAREFGYEKYFEELTRARRANSENRARNMNMSYTVAAMKVIGTDVLPEEKYMGDLMDHHIPYSFDEDSDVFYLQKEMKYLNSDEDLELIADRVIGPDGKVQRQIFQSKCIGLWMAPCNVNYAIYNFEDQPNYWNKTAETRAVINMQAFIGSPLNDSDRNKEIERALILGRGYKEILRQLKADIEIQKLNMGLIKRGTRKSELRTKYNGRYKIFDTVYKEEYYIPHTDCRHILPLFRLMYKDPESGIFKIKEIAEQFFMEKLNIDKLYEQCNYEFKDNWECEGGQAFILRVRNPESGAIQETHLLNGTIIHYESCLYYRLKLDQERETSQIPTKLIIGCLDTQKEFYKDLFEDYAGRNVLFKSCGSAKDLLDFSLDYLVEEVS